MSWATAFKMNCRGATYLHQKKKEGRLTLSERVGLLIHLAYCSFCKMFFKQLDLLEKTGKTPEQKDAILSDSAKAAIQRAFNAELKK